MADKPATLRERMHHIEVTVEAIKHRVDTLFYIVIIAVGGTGAFAGIEAAAKQFFSP